MALCLRVSVVLALIFLTSAQTYVYKSEKKSFYDAEADCQSMGRHLATIHSEADNAAVVAAGPAYNSASWNLYWIGLGTVGTGTSFSHWSDGSAVTFTKWYPGEPNRGNGGIDDCVHMGRYAHGQWNDDGCQDLYAYLCGPVVPGSGGDPIFRSLDGLGFEYHGICPVELLNGGEETRFSVVARNSPCGLKSCLEAVHLQCGEHNVVMSIGNPVLVDEKKWSMKQLLEKEVIAGPVAIKAVKGDRIHAGSDVVVKATCGDLSLEFTGSDWGMLRVDVKGETSGMLGNNDGKRFNDMMYRDGRVVQIRERDLNEKGRFANQTELLSWAWDWVVHKEHKTKEECRSVTPEEMIKKHCTKEWDLQRVRRMCGRMLSVLPTSRSLCGNSHEELLDKCMNLACSCFRFPKKLLKCTEWALREIVDECEISRGVRMDPNTESGWVY